MCVTRRKCSHFCTSIVSPASGNAIIFTFPIIFLEKIKEKRGSARQAVTAQFMEARGPTGVLPKLRSALEEFVI